MNKQSGFTLIELVVVIIIIGILAATAVPKFVDLQSDARVSALQGLKGALESAATLTYSRAAIDGEEGSDASDGAPSTGYDANGINIVYGYPLATEADLQEAAGLSTIDWTIVASDGTAYITSAGGTSGVTSTCKVVYIQPTDEDSGRPEIYLSGGTDDTTDVSC